MAPECLLAPTLPPPPDPDPAPLTPSPPALPPGLAVFNGRELDGHVIRASHATLDEWQRAEAGEWVSKQAGVAGIPLPGLYAATPLPAGITGLTALNPALAALIQTNPGIAAMMTAGIAEDEVPFEEGWVKVRGFPRSVTKADLIAFFAGCGALTEGDAKMVMSADGTSLGEAFLHFQGPTAKLRLALAKDSAVMPVRGHCGAGAKGLPGSGAGAGGCAVRRVYPSAS